jgi:signal transduction histidine kinase
MSIDLNSPMRWWSDRPIHIKGLIVFAVPIMVLLGTLLSGYMIGVQASRAQEDIRRTMQVQRDIQAIHALLAEAASGVRGYLLTKNSAFLAPYLASENELPDTLRQLHSRLRDTQQNAWLDELNSLTIQKKEGLAELLRLGPNASPTTLTQAMLRNKKVLDALRKLIEKMLAREEQLQQDSIHHANAVQERTMLVTAGSVIAGMLGTLLASLLFSSGIVRRLHQLKDNAGLLAHGMPLVSVSHAKDEIGQLSNRLERASELLTSRSEEVLRAQQEAERANRSKTEFLSRTSHELRTPLNAILGFAQLLYRDPQANDARQSLEHILKGGRHLLALIDEVLDIARIESGHLALNPQRLEASEIWGEALAMMAPLAAAKEIQLTGPKNDLNICLLADRQRLRQVLLNLISNAIKYSHKKGRVTLSMQLTPTHARLQVDDNGIGIATAMQERLFTPFDRLGADRHLVEGHGLGLVVARQLILAMGGDIGMSSIEGEGSCFWIEVPRSLDKPARESACEPHYLNAVRRACTMLYIEEQSSNLILVEMLLARGNNVRLLTAINGRDGLDIARQQMPELILLDLQLPDMSGEEVLNQIRLCPILRQIPVVVLSADVMPATIERLHRAGADDYLTKPLDVTLFFSTINRLLP